MSKTNENSQETIDDKPKKWRFWLAAIIAIIVVVGLWLASWGWIDCCISPTQRGIFGDKFGAVNALFSGLAFAGMIITLYYQREELELQRKELAQTHKELKNQREEFKEQNKTLKRQRFENTFFNMLSLQQEIVANLSYTKYHGREIFEQIYENIGLFYRNDWYDYGIRNIIEDCGPIVYVNIPETTRFDHYFRHLYHIIKYVNESELIEDCERYEYISIVRSQLSDYELVMLFYNCISLNGFDKFKPLIEKYALLNNLRDELLAQIEHKDLYKKSAYEHVEALTQY